jgi:hypothetical protein
MDSPKLMHEGKVSNEKSSGISSMILSGIESNGLNEEHDATEDSDDPEAEDKFNEM